MKLAEVTRAHELVGHRRALVASFVDMGSRPISWDRTLSLFGFPVDQEMRQALRTAARAEVRARIDAIDVVLGALGVEVDGIEVVILAEEERVARQRAEAEAKVNLKEKAA